VLRRIVGAGWLAAWLVVAALAVDLAHPLFVPCNDSGDCSGGSHEHPTFVSRETGNAADGEAGAPRAPGCSGERSVPARRSASCCAHGGCLCCGVAVSVPGSRPESSSALARLQARTTDSRADGTGIAVYHPPRA
jgi:hypothetical protein